MLSSFSELLGYDPQTGEAFNNGYYSEVSKNYSYENEIDFINPLSDAYDNMCMNILLVEFPEKVLQRSFFNNLGALSNDFVKVYQYNSSTFNGGINYAFVYGVNSIQQNGLPTKIGWGTLDFSADFEVHYE